MFKITSLNKVSFFLVLFSSLNWGMIGLLKVNLVSIITFQSVLFQRIIYVLFSLAALNLISLLYKCYPFNSYK